MGVITRSPTCPYEKGKLCFGLGYLGVCAFRKLLLTVVMLVGTNANANELKCSQAVDILAAMVVSDAPDDVIKYTINVGLNGRVSAEREREIYLSTMRTIHTIYGFNILGDGSFQDDWRDTARKIICWVNEAWPDDE